MTALLTVLLLAAPAKDGKTWSEKHGVGVFIPQTWKIVARDEGNRAFVVEGPQLGPSRPRAVLWSAGAAGTTLDAMAERLAGQVKSRKGWRVVATARKRIGPFPAVRMGIRFEELGGKGRARFTVALLGGSFYVLELSASASHFPGTTFDRIEQSLAVKWSEHEIKGGLVLKVPAGWKVHEKEGVLQLGGPLLGGERLPMIFVEHQPDGLVKPPTAKPGPKVTFLGAKREALQDERELKEEKSKLVLVHADGWTGAVMMPVAAWNDVFPIAAAILKTAKLKKPRAKG